MTLPGPEGESVSFIIPKGTFTLADLAGTAKVAPSQIEYSDDFQAALASRRIKPLQHSAAPVAAPQPTRPVRGPTVKPVRRGAGAVFHDALRGVGVIVSDAAALEEVIAAAQAEALPVLPAAPVVAAPPTLAPEAPEVPEAPEASSMDASAPAPVVMATPASAPAPAPSDELPAGAPNAGWTFEQISRWLRMAGISTGNRTSVGGLLRLCVGVPDPRAKVAASAPIAPEPIVVAAAPVAPVAPDVAPVASDAPVAPDAAPVTDAVVPVAADVAGS